MKLEYSNDGKVRRAILTHDEAARLVRKYLCDTGEEPVSDISIIFRMSDDPIELGTLRRLDDGEWLFGDYEAYLKAKPHVERKKA